MKEKVINILFLVLLIILVSGVTTWSLFRTYFSEHNYHSMSMHHTMMSSHYDSDDKGMMNDTLDDYRRAEFLSLRDSVQAEQRATGDYACCLAEPCTYCIAKTPGHGEGASCHCLDDVMNGRHPCGECIGEILEGHGNKFLTQYFATAIADEVGQEHLAVLQAIIDDKYKEE